MHQLRLLLEALASLRLTVTLLALSMVLVFAGTLAQVDAGIWEVIDGYFRSPIAWIDLQMFVPRQLAEVPWSVPFPGGFLIAGLLIVNLLAAHLLRFRLASKRIGIVALHAGLILMLAGEFVTGTMADEGLMIIDEGGSSNFVEDVRTTELAVIDRSDPESDVVTVVPEALLVAAARTGEPVRHPDLPFEVVVERWMPNSMLAQSSGPTRATAGVGLEAVPVERPTVSGVDGGQSNFPSAIVTLRNDGQTLGTWVVSANYTRPQQVDFGDDASRHLILRFEREYKPYTLHLIDFRHDKFVGTEVPRNFSSEVRLVDPTRGVDREVLIWMNNPLRYSGEAFYQASYKPDNSGTVLQVVDNPGWLIPYIACVIVTAGMLLHFVLKLWTFLRRRSAGEAKAVAAAKAAAEQEGAVVTGRTLPLWERALPWGVGVLGLAMAMSGLMRPGPGADVPFDVAGFGQLPVSAGGRVKPMDTVARNALMVAGGRQEVRFEDGRTLPATTYLLDLMARPEQAKTYPVIRVDHPDVLALMGRSPEQAGRLALADLEAYWPSIVEQARRAAMVESRQRDPFQRAVLELHSKVDQLVSLSQMRAPYAVPPLAAGQEWQPLHKAFTTAMAGHADPDADRVPLHPAAALIIDIMSAYHDQDAASFNDAIGRYTAMLDQALPSHMQDASIEVLFNRASPFYGATLVYVLAFVLVCVALLIGRGSDAQGLEPAPARALRKSATGLVWAALIVHTLGLVLRMYLQDRPPVTNLYSSAVFVGWAAVLLAMVMERLFPLGLATLGASAIGFLTLIVAHNLGTDGDTMQMMQAVLDSNFWLASHVITITLGYSTVFLAGVLAIVYVVLGVFTRWLTKDIAAALTRMVYASVCFALLLSFVGTVLGGIWADQSWGRFWGWDPKENGAILVVLITAIILHARFGGMVKARGIMVLAIAGNIVTAWSWFGTNMLGVGLHSYGFIDSAAAWLMLFVVSQFLLMALGLLPFEAWRSREVAGLR